MNKLLKILLIDILLIVVLIILFQFAAFFLGYSTTSNHAVEEKILLGIFILGNLVANYFVNKKMRGNNSTMLISSAFVLVIYVTLLASSPF